MTLHFALFRIRHHRLTAYRPKLTVHIAVLAKHHPR